MTAHDIALGKFARALINRKVHKLAGYGLFPDMDYDDLDQALVLRLLAGMCEFDPSRAGGSAGTNAFVSTVVERAADALVRERLAAKRNVKPRPLDADGATDPPDPVAEVEARQTDLNLDVAVVVAALPADLRAVAEALMRARNVTDAARLRRVARSSFVRQVEKLRRHLENTDLKEYLESGGTGA